MLRITNGNLIINQTKNKNNVDETSKPQIENKTVKYSKLPAMGLIKFMGIGDMRNLQELKKELHQIGGLGKQGSLLDWTMHTEDLSSDEEEHCSDAKTKLSLETKSKITSPKMGYLLDNLANADNLNVKDKALVKHWKKVFDDQTKIPEEFTERFSKLGSESYLVWRDSRKNNNYEAYAPKLANLINCVREQANYLNPNKSPYDVMLNEYDEGMSSEKLDQIFGGLKEELVPFIKKINDKVEADPTLNEFKFLENPADMEQMQEFATELVKDMGFDEKRGMIGKTAHPFMTGIDAPKDVRIAITDLSKTPGFTTATVANCLEMIGSIMHEAGHALVEQNADSSLYRTGLVGASMGIHESQSRLWENMVGKSKPFWNHYYPKLQEKVDAFKNVSFDDFYKAINAVKPNKIRIDADEATYNLHVMLRYDIEKEMMDTSKAPEVLATMLPQKWNDKMEEYLGLRPNNDSEGILQDVHWSDGSIGYFPSYTIGNLASAQIFNKAKEELPNLQKNEWDKNDLKSLKDWLTEKIYKNGTVYTPEEIIKNTTGEKLNPKYFTDYIKDKYSEIYNLNS